MSARIEVVDPGVLRLVLPGGAANAYLFLGKRTTLVDCGSAASKPALVEALRRLEIPRERIELVVLTHEHASHAGGADLFPGAFLAAHALAAARLRLDASARAPEVELRHGAALRMGGFAFDVLETPGHSSGSICLYERTRALIVTGDTVFARGAVRSSESVGEHVDSLERLASLRARMLLPGHGPVSDDPVADISLARDRLVTGAESPAPAEEVA
jgi:glyoxylase-like metal-dependent hydrolase (beta-lactamase superfamily II)